MAEACLVKTLEPVFTFVLCLTKQEARCLKAMVQNPVCEDEVPVAANLRKVIFNELGKEV